MIDLLSLADLPPVSLISGVSTPDSVGTLIADVIKTFNINFLDTLNFPTLTVESSQLIHEFAETEPIGHLKLVIVSMTRAHVRAQNALLTLLEDPPSRLRFLLFNDTCVIDTIRSRSYIFTFAEPKSFSKQSKSITLAALKACSELNDILLEDLFKNWDDETTQLLVEWAVESMLRCPKVFTMEELSMPFPKGFHSNVVTALATVGAARGRLSVKSIMLSYVERSKGVK